MDEAPFLEINMQDLKETQVAELKKFHKSTFDINEIVNVASELKYSNEFKKVFASELQNPSDDMVKLFLVSIYKGTKTQNVIEKFRPIVKKSLNQFISEMMNDKIKNALSAEENAASDQPALKADSLDTAEPEHNQPEITTTQEELEAYFVVKNLLKDVVPMQEITFKDTESYIAILYKNNVRKWICRLVLTSTQKIFILPGENKKEIRSTLESVYDIEQYKEQLLESLNRYL